MLVAPRIVKDIPYVTRIKDGNYFSTILSTKYYSNTSLYINVDVIVLRRITPDLSCQSSPVACAG